MEIKNYDVAIIGGGVIGCSIARALSKYKLKVALLEKNQEVCQETSKANSAIIHGGYDCKVGTLKARFNVAGNKMFPELSKELGFVFRKIGSLVLAFDQEEVEAIEELYRRGKINGVENLEIIDRKKVLEMEPKVSNKVIAALYCKDAGVVDPFNLTYAMIENAVENGVDLYTKTEVKGLEKEGQDAILLHTNKEDFRAKYVVNAAGLNSDKVAKMAGDEDFYIKPTKGIYRLMRKNPKESIQTVLFQTPTKKGKGILVTSTYEGNTMVGPSAEEITTEEDALKEEDALNYVDQAAKKSVPNLNEKNTIRIFTGVRAKPDTGDFMIYPSKKMEGLVHCGGIESPGLSSSPAIADYVVELFQDLGCSKEAKTDFSPYRKAIPRLARMKKEEKEKYIIDEDAYGEIICRCEQVSKGEILEAIHRTTGARTVGGVKRRTRAGMGPCQGNYCRPRVLKILGEELHQKEEVSLQDVSGEDIVKRYLKKPSKEEV